MARDYTVQKKKDIDFDVYEKQDPESVVNWGAEAKKITDTMQKVVDTREEKKAAITKSFQDQQTALQDIGEYENQTIQQFVMNGGQDVANKALDIQNLVERGLMKPSDATMWQHNATTGFKQVKNNAANFDKVFTEYTKRTTDETNSVIERDIAQSLEGFANMNNMVLEADPETGELMMLRTDENGEVIPGESMSVQRMSLLMKQRIDAFDSNAAAADMAKTIGTIVDAELKTQGVRVEDWETERSRVEDELLGGEKREATQEDVDNGLATAVGEEIETRSKTLTLKANEMLGGPESYKRMTMMREHMETPNGTPYETDLGGKKHEQWLKDNPNEDPANNPFIKMKFKGDGLWTPDLTDEQKANSTTYAEDLILSNLKRKTTVEVEKIQYTPPPNPNQSMINADKEDAAKSSKLGDYITILTDEDPKKRDAVEKSLRTARNAAIEKYNAKVTNDEDKVPLIQNITKGKPPRPATQKDVENGLAENVGDQVIEDREIILSDGERIKIQGTFLEQTRLLESIYNPDNMLTTDDIKRLAKDRGFDLDTEITGGKGKKQKRTQEDIDKWVKDNPGKTAADAPFKIGDSYYDYSETDKKTSQKAFAPPNYKTDLMIKGKNKVMTAEEYMNAEYGYGKGAEFNSSVDTTSGIGEGMVNLITASLDPEMLEIFNTTPGMELEMTYETGPGQDSVTFNFGGRSLTIGGPNGDLHKGDLYGGNGYELWEQIQLQLLNPAIKELNDKRTGKTQSFIL